MAPWKSWLLSSRRYSKVESSDYDEEGKLHTHSEDDNLKPAMGSLCNTKREYQQQPPIMKVFVIFNTMLFALSLWLFIMAMKTGMSDVSNQERNYFLKKTSEPCKLTITFLYWPKAHPS
jgi:heme/copper-type cytochrome/quinol oxidase subunit 3